MARVEVVNQNVGRQPLYGTGIWSDGRAHVGSPMRIAQDFGSDVVTVQEVLLSHFEQFKEHMGWYGEFVHKNEPHEELTGEYKGEAILSKYPIIDKTVIDLGTPLVETGKNFNLLVVAIDHPGFRGSGQTLNVATTHLWSAGHDKNGVLYPNEVNQHGGACPDQHADPRIAAPPGSTAEQLSDLQQPYTRAPEAQPLRKA